MRPIRFVGPEKIAYMDAPGPVPGPGEVVLGVEASALCTADLVPNSILSAEEHLVHVHINDNDGTGDQHLVPGDGNIDFRATFAALHKSATADICPELEQEDGDSAAIRSKKFMGELLRERGN